MIQPEGPAESYVTGSGPEDIGYDCFVPAQIFATTTTSPGFVQVLESPGKY